MPTPHQFSFVAEKVHASQGGGVFGTFGLLQAQRQRHGAAEIVMLRHTSESGSNGTLPVLQSRLSLMIVSISNLATRAQSDS